MPICPNCGNQAAENALFCDQCGTKIPPAEPPAQPDTPTGGVPEGILVCPACGAENVPGEVFCDVCGEPLEAPEPVAATAEETVIEAEVVLEEVPADETIVEAEVVEAEVVVDADASVVDVDASVVDVDASVAEDVVAPEGDADAPAPGEEVFCPVCGAGIGEGDTFCGTCGASLGEPAEDLTATEAPADAVAEVEEEPADAGAPVEEEPADAGAPVEEKPADAGAAAEGEAPTVTEVTPEQEPACPICGAQVLPDQRFCASCGAALQPVEAPGAAPPAAAPPAAAGPHLVVVASGAVIPLVAQPQLLLGRTDEVSGIYPDVDITPHGGEDGGVSRRHARLIHEGDAWYVMDLDSTNGTYLNDAEIAPRVRVPVQDGDTVALGEVRFAFHAG